MRDYWRPGAKGRPRGLALLLMALLAAAGCPGETAGRLDQRTLEAPLADLAAGEVASLLDGRALDGTVADAPRPPDARPAADARPADTRPPCQPGTTETLKCGACNTGSKTRSCSSGEWSAWSSCLGAQAGFPYHPVSGALVCPPYAKPAIFFAPHPDDESIMMGGAIKEHLVGGRQVFVELLTHGTASGVINVLNGKTPCKWHGTTHSYGLSTTAFGNARVAEFKDAMTRLGVHGIHISDYQDGSLTKAQAATRIGFWLTQVATPPLSLKGNYGQPDIHVDHANLWYALVSSGHNDIRGYHWEAVGTLLSSHALGSTACTAKKNALDAYKKWDPASGRYAIGYHSVSAVINLVSQNCLEWVYYLN